MIRIAVAVAVAVALAAGCSDDAPGSPDAEPAPDAGTCGAEAEFSGGYQDWDSTSADFVGIFDAVVTEVGDAANTATTAPNGRSTLCLPAAATSQVTFAQSADGFVPARYTFAPAADTDLYEVRGITTTRIATFYTELGNLTWDQGTALVQVEVRGKPSGDPVDGVSISIGGAASGFHKDAANAWVAGATTGGGRFVIYPNVPISGGGEVTLGVLAPGRTCDAPETIHVVAGEVAMTTVACED